MGWLPEPDLAWASAELNLRPGFQSFTYWKSDEMHGMSRRPPPGLPETRQRGGHIPGAKNIPWGMACNEDGSFKSPDELAALYKCRGITSDKPTIAYCRIGERSSHTWFVLKYLVGYNDVKNYDGSWTEWAIWCALQSSRKPRRQWEGPHEWRPGQLAATRPLV